MKHQYQSLFILLLCIYSAHSWTSFDLKLTNGQTYIVSGGPSVSLYGGSNPTFITSALSSQNQIPGEVSSVDFTFNFNGFDPSENVSISLSYNHALATWSNDSFSVTPADAATPGSLSLHFNCASASTVMVQTNLTIQNGGGITNPPFQTFTFYLSNKCANITDPCLSACTDSDSVCSKGITGYTCTRRTSKTTSDNVPDTTKIVTWDLGNPRSGDSPYSSLDETNAQYLQRHRDIASFINTQGFSVVALQSVWDDSIRRVLNDELLENYPFITTRTFASSANLNSGLFFASQFYIVDQDFQPFTSKTGLDSSYDKGIFSALLQVRPTLFLFVISASLQSGTGALFDSVRASQLIQIQTYMKLRIATLTGTYSAGSMGVLIMGDFQLDALGNIASSITYSNMVTALGSPTDYYRQQNSGASSKTYGGISVAASSNTTVTLPTACLDYIFGATSVIDSSGNDVDSLELTISSVSTLTNAVSTSTTPFGGSSKLLSSHLPVEIQIDTKEDLLLIILLPVLALVIVLALVAAALIQMYVRKRPIWVPVILRPHLRQTFALYKKNWLLTVRDRRAVIIQLLVPFVLMFFLWVLKFALESNQSRQVLTKDITRQEVSQVSSLPRCIIGQYNTLGLCYSLGYVVSAGNEAWADAFIEIIRSKNNIPVEEVQPRFASYDAAQTYLLANVNVTQGVYYLYPVTSPANCTASQVSGGTCTLISLTYDIQYNQTATAKGRGQTVPAYDVLLPLQSALESAVFIYSNGDDFDYKPSLLQFPHPALSAVDIISTSGPSFFLGCLMFNLVIQLGQIVAEKEFNLRQAMTVVGLKDSVYWFTWITTNMIWNALSGFLLVLAGLIFQFDFFLKNDFGTYFFLFVLFGISMVPLTMFLSLFVSQTRTATTIGFALFLIGVIAQVAAAAIFTPSTADYIKYLLALLPFILLSKGISDLSSFSSNSSSVGLRWFDRGSYASEWTIEQVYYWLMIDFAIYLVLTVTIDFLFGGVYGESRVRKWIGRLGRASVTKEQELTDADVADEAKAVRDGKFKDSAIVIDGLTKVFKNYSCGCIHKPKLDFTAVDHICLHMDNGQLFCLLGHNGAGKSTTISMMTGLLEPSSGDAMILGSSLRKETAKVRKDIGVCPQFDILWNELTAGEHISLFGALKNLSQAQIKQEIQERLKEVDLQSVEKVPAGTFSGGMKRRLSVAVSLTGSPAIVFLDEPTTGMDPVSRRQLWNLLEKEKSKRLILLTTHSMEEADVLGDKIAIMKKGMIHCIGTSLRLKTRFSGGYRLTLVTNNDEKALETIKTYLPSAVQCRDPTPHTMHYEIPFDKAEELPKFLNELETLQDSGIEDAQVGMTSLEDVFLKVAGLEHEKIDEAGHHSPHSEKTSKKEADEANKKDEYPSINRKNQFKAMFIKTGLTQLRQYKTTLCQILFPLGLIAILFGFQALVNSLIQDELGPTTPTVFNPRAFALPPYFIQTAEFDPSDNTACPPVYTLTSRPTVALDAYAGRTMIANPAGWSGLGSFGASLGSIDFWNPNTPLTEEPSGFLGKFPRDVTSYFSLKAAVQVTQGNRVTLCQSRYYYTPILPDTSKTSLDDIQSTIYSSWANSIINGGYVFNNVKLNGTGQVFDYTIVYNYTLTRGGDLGILQNLISSTLFRSQSVFPQSSLKFNSTFDYPSLESVNEFDIVSLVFAAFAIFIFQLMFPVVLSYLVYEKEFKLREIMKMSGLKTYVYWIVNYLVFFLIYLIAMEIMHLVGFLFGFKIFVTNDFWTVFFLILTWGNCMLAMAFFFSTLFSNSRTSVVFGYILIFAAGLLSSQLIQNYFSSDDTPYGTIFGISIIPMFSLYRGILALASAVRFDGAGLVITDLTTGFGQELREVYGYLVVESIILFLLAAYCELVVPSGVGIKLHPLFMFQPSYWRNRMAAKKNKTSQLKPTKPEDGEPEDVKEERRDAWDDSKNWPVAALDLRKVYEAGDGAPEKIAVNNLCLTVRRGECFGLLGPNGSGKSTTINMISGFFQPTSGTVRYFGDLDIRSDTDVIHLMTGVCPQDSLIWDALTAAEHLQFYGRLRNLKGKDLDDEVAYRLQQVNLYKVRDKLAGKFSGGMKRRLCVAMSLIGSPKVVLLDEPTTGLDPASRNALWDVVRRSKQESSLLLTTHSMEEAEALCERVGIFVNSRMKSIGTPANLKTRIGKYYKVSVTSAVSTEAKVQQLLMELAPKAELFNAPVPGTRSYQILRESVKLADLFAAFSKWSKDEELKIQDYSISNISLEEVFLQITLKELAKEEEDKKEKRPKNELVELP